MGMSACSARHQSGHVSPLVISYKAVEMPNHWSGLATVRRVSASSVQIGTMGMSECLLVPGQVHAVSAHRVVVKLSTVTDGECRGGTARDESLMRLPDGLDQSHALHFLITARSETPMHSVLPAVK